MVVSDGPNSSQVTFFLVFLATRLAISLAPAQVKGQGQDMVLYWKTTRMFAVHRRRAVRLSDVISVKWGPAEVPKSHPGLRLNVLKAGLCFTVVHAQGGQEKNINIRL